MDLPSKLEQDKDGVAKNMPMNAITLSGSSIHSSNFTIRNYFRGFSPEEIDEAFCRFTKSIQKNISVLLSSLEPETIPLLVVRTTGQSSQQLEPFSKADINPGLSFDIDKLFSVAKKEAEVKAKSNLSNQLLAYEDFVQKHGNIIGVIGIAGSGKSTLGVCWVKWLVSLDNSNGKNNFVFYVLLRHIDFNKKMNVLQFLYNLPTKELYQDQLAKDMLERLQNTSSVNIVFDALDEIPSINLSKTVPHIALYDTATPDIILKNLLNGNILPEARKMVLSRPEAYHDLHVNYKPQVTYEVKGLQQSPSNASPMLKQFMLLHPSFQTLYHLPIFAKMLERLSSHKPYGILSVTDLFMSYTEYIVRSPNVTMSPIDLPKLAQLAFNGTIQGKFSFTFQDLKEMGLNAKECSEFLNTKVGIVDRRLKILEGDKRVNFNHVHLQEFFAAIKLLFLSDLSTFSQWISRLNVERSEVLLRFLCGLCKPENVQTTFRVFSLSCSDLQQKADVLKQLLQTMIREIDFPEVEPFASAEMFFNPSALFKEPKNQSWKDKLIFVLRLTCEADHFASQIVSEFPSHLQFMGPLSAEEVSHLCYALSVSKREISVSIGSCQLPVVMEPENVSLMTELFPQNKHKLLRFHIAGATLTDPSNSVPTALRELSLQRCQLHPSILQKITESLDKIQYLDLSGSSLPESTDFAKLVKSCKFAKLVNCSLSEQSIVKLSETIARRQEPIEMLNLGRNKLNGQAAMCLSKCVHKVQSLMLSECGLTSQDVKSLSQHIEQRNNSMSFLGLGNNFLSNVDGLSLALPKIQKLWLDNCNINTASIAKIFNSLLQRTQPMKWLRLDNNHLEMESVRLLSQCLPNISVLSLNNCGLSDDDVCVLAQSISQLQSPLQQLDIILDHIGDQAVRALAHSLPKISVLRIAGDSLKRSGDSILLQAESANRQTSKVMRF